jgi:integrase
MARVKDLWFSEVPKRDDGGKVVKDEHNRVVYDRKKTVKHPDRGGSKTAKRWLACWSNPDGKEETKAFHKQSDAKAYADKMEGDAQRDEYIEKDAGKEKFGPLAEKWIRLRSVGGSSRERYERVYANQVRETLAHRAVRGVKASEILEWLRSPEIARLSGTMKSAAYLIVAGTFDLAVEDKLRRDNPARSKIIPVPRQEDTERELWPVCQVWAVTDAHPEQYRVIPVMEAGMGLRQGCAFAMAEDDFDFEAATAAVQRQIVRVRGRYYFKLPKGGKARTVPVSTGVQQHVQRHVQKFPPVECTLPWLNEDGTEGDPLTVNLLTVWHGDDPRTNGRHILPVIYDSKVWKPALHAAGIAPEPVRDKRRMLVYSSGGRGNGQHALRHFFSTALQDGGVPPAGVMEFMGHSKKGLPVTFRVYGHVTEETFEQARAAIDQRLFRLRPVPSTGTVTELRRAQ